MSTHSFWVHGCATLSWLLLSTGCAVANQSLAVPDGFSSPVVVGKRGHSECPTAPVPFVGSLNFPSKYEGSGTARDELNPDAEQRYKGATESISQLEAGVASLTSRYLQRGSISDLSCVLSWLDRWATQDALLGEAKTHTGKSVRKWALASISASYLRLQRSASNPLIGHDEQRAHIEQWLRAIASRVVVEWPLSMPSSKVNNHYYWAAWSLVATGTALNDSALFDYGLAIFRTFEGQLTVDGLLPNEVARRSRALNYHAYALAPLAMIATFAVANGKSIEVDAQSPLGRLASTVFDGFQSPDRFAKLVGVKQETSSSVSTNFSWLEPYCAITTCNESMGTFLQAHRPLKSTRMGGDLTALFSRTVQP